MADGLIAAGQAQNVLLLTGETYSKFIHPKDRSVKVLFGDAGSATLVRKVEAGNSREGIGPFVFGTDGAGADHLIVPQGGARSPYGSGECAPRADGFGNQRTSANLYMNGPEIFEFTSRRVPELVEQMLARSGLERDDIGLFVFHQANRYMLEHLRRKIGIPVEKFVYQMAHCGNTVSSSIPIALHGALAAGRLTAGTSVMLLGFGVGYSFAATVLRWGQGVHAPQPSLCAA
jgi:3-oxoacyl-[acyl-carrier-protein] synthase III